MTRFVRSRPARLIVDVSRVRLAGRPDSQLSPRRVNGAMEHEVEFSATLFRVPGPGGWTFAPVPEQLAPSRTEAWGRAPVEASVDGHSWRTSVWRERSGRTLLPVPKAVRRGKEHGDTVQVTLRFSSV